MKRSFDASSPISTEDTEGHRGNRACATASTRRSHSSNQRGAG